MSYKGPRITIRCRDCGFAERMRASVIRRNFGKRPTYFLCNICNRVPDKRWRPDGTTLVSHYPSIGRFSAYTVEEPSPEIVEARLHSKAILAQKLWPAGYGDA